MNDNTVQYVIDLQDRLTAKFEAMYSKVASVSQKVEKSAGNIQKGFEKTGDAITRVPGKIEALNAKLEGLRLRQERAFTPESIAKYNRMIQKTEGELQKLNHLPGEGFFARLRKGHEMLSGLGGPITKILGLFGGYELGKGIIELTANVEQTHIAFSTLLGSEEKAKKLLGQMSEYADKTPFEKQDIHEAGKALIAYGMDADQIMPTLKMLGDVSMGDKEHLQLLTLAYGKVASKGRITGEEVRMMVDDGFNPLMEISKMTGQSMESLNKQMEKGAISADMVKQAFEHATGPGGRFFQMMEKQSQTLAGRWSTLVDAIKKVGLMIGEKLMPTMKKFLEDAFPFVEWIGNNIDGIMKLTGLILGLVGAFKVMGIVMSAINIVMAMTPLGWIIIGIGVLITALTVLYQKFAFVRGIIQAVWGGIKEFAKGIWDSLVNVVMGLVKMFTGLGHIISSIFHMDWAGVKAGAAETAGGFTQAAEGAITANPIGFAIKNGKKIAGAVKKGYQEGSDEYYDEQIASMRSGKEKTLFSGPSGSEAGKFGETGAGAGSDAAGSGAPFDPGKAIDSVSKGGVTNITVTFGKLIDQLIIQGKEHFKESVDQMEDQLSAGVLRIISSANKIATKQ